MSEQYEKEMIQQQAALKSAAIRVVNEQIVEVINRTCECDSDETFYLSEQGKLSDMKIRMQDLLNTIVPKKIEDALNYFTKNNFQLIRDKHEYELTDELYSKYKSIIAEAGKLLREYGYKNVYGEYEKGKSNFLSMKHKGTMGPKPDDDDLIKIQSKWIMACEKYIEELNRQENAIKAEKAKKARELWENA